MAGQMDGTAISNEPRSRQEWSIVAYLLVLVLFAQAVFAGAMLSGFDWAQTAHRVTALVVIASAIVAGLVSAITLRRVRHGLKFSLTLLGLAALLFLQAALGALSAKGANLLWLHVPLGVALVGIAGQAVASARRLGSET